MRRALVADERAAVSLLGKSIDNSQVVRELDPRSGRELWLLLLLVSGLVGGLVLYAWPTLELRRAGAARAEMARERERLLEENRKLRLEKAVLENLPRVETIAVRDLHLRPPSPDEVVVVEPPPAPPRAGVVASGAEPGRARN